MNYATIPSCFPFTENTSNTTVFHGMDQYQTAVAVANAVWNPADTMKRPNVVILVRGDGCNYQDALISSSLIHFPRNGPVLFTEPYYLNPVTLNAIVRFRPSGANSPAQVITVGSLSPAIDFQVKELGFSVFHINGGNPAVTATLIWDLIGTRQDVILTSGENFTECTPAGGWAAHMGDPILLSWRDYLPKETAQAIRQKRPNVYILGSTKTISESIEQEVRCLTTGLVERISGTNPFEVAVNFTKYKSSRGDFGWNIRTKKGWSFRFSRYDDWAAALSGNPFSHMGKHSPLLLIDPRSVPDSVRNYLISVNPHHPKPEPPYMHGFIVGIDTSIACSVQSELDDLLETVME